MTANKPNYTQGCVLLYDSVPNLNTARLQSILNPQGILRCDVQFEGRLDERHLVVRGQVHLENHEMDVILVAAPADDQATQLAILEALLAEEDRQALLRHQAYIHCLYAGGSPDPLEQLRALYRVAGALIHSCTPAQALGLLDIPALQGFAIPELLDLLRWLDADPPPIGLWVRIVGLGGNQGDMWLTTRGLAHFFQPEIAVNGRHAGDAESAESLLMSIASWLIQGTAKLHLGDTLDMLAEEGLQSRVSHWRCGIPSHDQQWFASPYGTLILEPA